MEVNCCLFDGFSLLNHPINISLPIFNFHQSNETYLHAQIAEINVERLSKEIKKDKQIYYSHESEMQYRLNEIRGPHFVWFYKLERCNSSGIGNTHNFNFDNYNVLTV